MLRITVQRAGLAGQGVTPYRLRHTFATHLIRSGVVVRMVRELLGPSELQTTADIFTRTRAKQAPAGRLSGLLDTAGCAETQG
jgi:site-specific recombinase XerD